MLLKILRVWLLLICVLAFLCCGFFICVAAFLYLRCDVFCLRCDFVLVVAFLFALSLMGHREEVVLFSFIKIRDWYHSLASLACFIDGFHPFVMVGLPLTSKMVYHRHYHLI